MTQELYMSRIIADYTEYIARSDQYGGGSEKAPKKRRADARKEVIYPESDGKPMADNTKQFEWIVKIKEGLEILFSDTPDVFVAGDFFWYPVEGNNKIRVAPDALVVFGRPKGHRGSYLQWKEGNIAPQVVFEILSPGNRRKEMDDKLKFYEKYGVEEYYMYDPDNIRLSGWIRSSGKLSPVENMDGWISPGLKIRFEIGEDDLTVYRPDGQKFLTPTEIQKKAEEEKRQAEKERQRAEKEKQRAEKERQRAEKEKQRAEKEKRQAEKERQRAEQSMNELVSERQRADRFAAKLREMGISPEAI